MQRKAPHPGWNLDYLMFLFTRISGLCIVLLALAGVTSAFLMGARDLLGVGTVMRWLFFPNPNHVMAEVPDVAAGWSNSFWQIMQMLLIFFAGTHGLNGLRMILEDYISHRLWLLMIRLVLFLAWLFMLIVCIYVILAS